MSSVVQDRFHPKEGALLDLRSLLSLAAAPDRLLEAALQALRPGANGLVLEGFEPGGEWSSSGPPGTLRPHALTSGMTVSPGRAVLTDSVGRPFLLEVEQPLDVKWPTSAGPAVRGALVLLPRIEAAATDSGLAVARERITAELGFVRPEQASHPQVLVLARSLDNGRDWALDERRLWQPEHPAVELLLKRLESIEHSVWRAEPEGAVWDRQVLGRNWVRYQTVAAAALQAARFQLSVHAMTTQQRVRTVRTLRIQLERSVEVAATQLLQLIGAEEDAGAWAGVFGASL